MRLKQASGVFYGTDDVSLSVGGYTSNQFILGLDLENLSQASRAGVSTKDGSIVQLEVNNSGLSAGDTVMIFLVYDGLLNIKDGHCEVFE